jgi:hypothetical protein
MNAIKTDKFNYLRLQTKHYIRYSFTLKAVKTIYDLIRISFGNILQLIKREIRIKSDFLHI